MQPKAANAPKELGKPLSPPTQVTRIRFSPDGKTLAAACFDGKVRRWDVSGKEPAELPEIAGHNGWVTDLAFDRNTLFSTDSWGRLTATDVSAKEPKRLWTVADAHDGWARGVAVDSVNFAPVTCGKDGIVQFWDRKTGEKLFGYEAKSDLLSVCCAPGGG